MTSEQISIVQSTFAKVEPLAEEAAVLFYARLFELDPDLRQLFKTDIAKQGRKLMEMIELAVNSLGRLDEIVPVLRALGARHVDYGVENYHYETVGVALLWTLEQALDEDFTPEAKEAWTAVYGFLAETMKDVSRQS